MSYAIVRAAGKQHRVAQGTHFALDRLQAEVGSQITLDEVLLLSDEKGVQIGQPLVAQAKVVARVVRHLRGPKIRVFKRRKRKGFHKTIGHRQELTHLEILSIGD